MGTILGLTVAPGPTASSDADTQNGEHSAARITVAAAGDQWTLGRNTDGVPTLYGSTDGPSFANGAGLLYIGLVLAAIPVTVFLAGLYSPLLIVFGLIALLPICTGAWMLNVRRRLRRLISEREVCARLGADPPRLRELVVENAIRPKYVINDVEYYNPADFRAIATLLRPAEAPPDNAALLRAAGTSETPSEQLLRSGLVGDEPNT